MEKKLGIPSSGYEYLNINSKQNRMDEFLKTQEFLARFFLEDIYNVAPEIVTDNMKLEFINYGDTQLVYVLSTLNGYYTLLVGQPGIQLGHVKEEFNILCSLAQNSPQLVVVPEYYYSNKEKEMYIAPYLMQARCIASQDTGWGIYVPEPFYRFEHFSPDEQQLVNTSIIANMIKIYDQEKGLGLASCKIGGGDFILEREWSFKQKDIASTLKHMKLIAARKMISVDFKTYINILQKEFKHNTYYKFFEDRDCSILVNHKSRIPMKDEEIEKGIQLGLKLRK